MPELPLSLRTPYEPTFHTHPLSITTRGFYCRNYITTLESFSLCFVAHGKMPLSTTLQDSPLQYAHLTRAKYSFISAYHDRTVTQLLVTSRRFHASVPA